MPDTYNDLQVVQRYIDPITKYIEGIVQEENVAIVLTCKVFERYKKRQTSNPFPSEEAREKWLYISGRNQAIDHLRHLRHEKEKEQAFGKAIHDCS